MDGASCLTPDIREHAELAHPQHPRGGLLKTGLLAPLTLQEKKIAMYKGLSPKTNWHVCTEHSNNARTVDNIV